MNFFAWLFNFSSRHSGDFLRYQRGKVGTRIFVMLLALVVAGATLGLEYWCIHLFNQNSLNAILVAILVLLFLVIPFAGATIDYCLAYAIFGFRMFVRGCIDKKAEKIDAQNQTADLEPQQQDKPKQKNYRWFDLVVGIYQILVLVATIAIGIILL